MDPALERRPLDRGFLSCPFAGFRHYADKHRPQTAARIVGYEVVDLPSDNQPVALARKDCLKHDRMAGTAPVT